MTTTIDPNIVIEGHVVSDIPNLKEKAEKQKKAKQVKVGDVRSRKEKILAIVGKYVGYLLGGTVLVGGAALAALAILGNFAGIPLMIGGLTWALLSLLGAGVIITPGLWLMGIGLVLFGINMLLRVLAG